MDNVKLMSRTDQKFCMHISQLPEILEAIRTDYSLLEMQSETVFKYNNLYFDTPDNQMFLNHHNGKLNRFKIRIRHYNQSDENFLEVKFKNNKGRTIKERTERENFDSEFSPSELNFIEQSSPFSGIHLESKIKSSFNRITLSNNDLTERITFDISPEFQNQENKITLSNLVVVEIKQNKASDTALITRTLRAHKIRSQSFSKYCIGRSLLEENLKKNSFKPLLMKIRKEYYY
jgi:hypothetical protein